MSVREICESAGLTSYLGATAENTYVEKDASAFDQQGIDNRVNTSWKRAENVIISDVSGIAKKTLLSQWVKLTDNGIHAQMLYYPIGNGKYEKYGPDGTLVSTDDLENLISSHNIKSLLTNSNCNVATSSQSKYLAAIRTKPFVLLAGISGTGKSRMVRQLARGCCPEKDKSGNTHPLYDEQKPGNFEMIQVRPNWHDSSELMGYVTRIVRQNEPPKYLVTAFVEFLAKAWVYREVPFFLCLDEMNLAPVEQYFAEYLSVIETRKRQTMKLGGAEVELITTDPIVRWENLEKETFANAVKDIFDGKAWANAALHGRVDEVKKLIENDKGIRVPPNLVVMGTVNMDETTCSFSRKVLDRAMSFELNDVSDMYDPSKIAGEGDAAFGSIKPEAAMSRMLTGKEAYGADNGIGEKVLGVLKVLNEEEVPAKKEDGTDEAGKMPLLAKTPFKIAYRTRNEIMIYCLERCGGQGLTALLIALDEALSMKVLSRIEGDNQHVPKKWLVTLSATIEDELKKLDGYDKGRCGVCREKLAEMAAQSDSGYTSFWTR